MAKVQYQNGLLQAHQYGHYYTHTSRTRHREWWMHGQLRVIPKPHQLMTAPIGGTGEGKKPSIHSCTGWMITHCHTVSHCNQNLLIYMGMNAIDVISYTVKKRVKCIIQIYRTAHHSKVPSTVTIIYTYRYIWICHCSIKECRWNIYLDREVVIHICMDMPLFQDRMQMKYLSS